MATCQEMVDWLRSKQGQWYYSNDLTLRENPEQSGCTDCSGTTQYAYRKFFGIEIGSWTGTQSHAGWEIARGHYPSEIPWDSLRPGDLIFMTATYWEQWDFAQYLCHVEMYSGNGNMIGSPSTPCPQEKNALNWMTNYGCITWMVRRILEDDDVSAEDVWSWQIGEGEYGKNDLPAWQRLGWIHHDVMPMYQFVTRRDDAGADFDTGADAYTRLVWIDKKTEEMRLQVAGLTEAVKALATTKGADPDAIAKEVGDAVAAKLSTIKLSVESE